MMQQEIRKIFELICSIPHPSGHETALAAALEQLASEKKLCIRRDAFGNLRIDRPASPGYEKSPVVIMQGHLDMVPQVEAGKTFDFLKEPVPVMEKDGFLCSVKGTTLGADNGIGVAAALAVLFDRELQCGPLAGLFTLAEETGLHGAMALDPEMLEGGYLLNLDSEEEGEFCIGCAGGVRLEAAFAPEFASFPREWCGIEIEVGGLAGGHSGINIDARRGNALKFLAAALSCLPEMGVASISGGSLDNAIPRDAKAVGAADAVWMPVFLQRISELRETLAGDFDAPESFRISIRNTEAPARIWTPEFRQSIVGAIGGCPDGVAAYDRELHAVRTSSNFAAVGEREGEIFFRTSQRSFSDIERDALTASAAALFEAAGGRCAIDSAYPGWTPDSHSGLLRKARLCYSALFGKEPEVRVIHAGLECGIFAGKNPKLEQISFGPTIFDPHSPAERVELASVERFGRFLRELLVNLR